MSQEDIVKYLRKNHPKWFNSRQLADALDASIPSVNICLGRLRRFGEVREKVLPVKMPCGLVIANKGVLHYSYKRL